jgi:hypothetical protein
MRELLLLCLRGTFGISEIRDFESDATAEGSAAVYQ